MIEVFAIGNLVRDPAISTTKNGTNVCSFSIGCRGNTPDSSEFLQVSVFGRQADSCSMYLKKGSRVAVTGTFSSRQYAAKDGTNRTSLQINADRVEFLSSSGGQNQAEPSNTRPQQNNRRQQAAPVDEGEDLPF